MEQRAARCARDLARKIVCAAGILLVAGCAGRAPQPVAVVQPEDRYIDCTAIQAEITANNKTVQELGSEEGTKVVQNVAAGVAGLFIWPLWFAMDFQGTAGKEEAALQSRQEYLASLALQRGCSSPAPAHTISAVSAVHTTPAVPIAVPATPAVAMAPPSVTPPQAVMTMTPCGADRPCLTQGTNGF
jgi:hypothetical protein